VITCEKTEHAGDAFRVTHWKSAFEAGDGEP
jgi:hypothetical protein